MVDAIDVVTAQSLSHVQLFATPWAEACQVSLSFTISQSLLKFMSFESVMPSSNHLILCQPLLLLPSIFPSIRVFSSESALHIRWPNIRASASVLPKNIQGEKGHLSCFFRIIPNLLHSTLNWKHFIMTQPTPMFLPGESQGWGSLVGCRLWGHIESDMTDAI